jgi:general secretion pathway protein H
VSVSGGFTLLEVVLVVTLIAITLTISYPALSRGGASLQLRATARDVLNTLRLAREKAITEQRVTRIVVDREKGQLVFTDEFGTAERAYTLKPKMRFSELEGGDQVIQEGPLVVRFLPNGSGERARIAIQADTGATIWVVTDPVTGGAKIRTQAEERP